MTNLSVRAAALFVVLAACSSSPDGSSPGPGPGGSGTPDAATAQLDAGPMQPTSACGATTADLALACVDKDRLSADTTFVAAQRTPGSPHWQAVQDACAARLEELGFEVRRQDYGTGVNVIGTLAGSSGDTVLVSAHYDHIDSCPGASDNAAGLAAALELARVFAGAQHARTLVVACWDEEEDGLLGSEAYAAELVAEERTAEILVALSFDSFGYSDSQPDSQSLPLGFSLLFPDEAAALEARDMRGDFVAVFGDSGASATVQAIAAAAEELGQPAQTLVLSEQEKDGPLTSDLRRSDHASFWAVDVPAIHLTDTADFRNPYYHCQGGADAVGTVDFDFVYAGTQAAAAAVAELLSASGG